MIETIHLLPPDLGPRSNPVLFGIAEALVSLLPLVATAPRAAVETPSASERAAVVPNETAAPARAETI